MLESETREAYEAGLQYANCEDIYTFGDHYRATAFVSWARTKGYVVHVRGCHLFASVHAQGEAKGTLKTGRGMGGRV